ncbi:MAG: hypothetical protein J2P45_09230 [Candidatus Dormibacteraeota bacterium]|nr:hypothetical protein [Candidatus Dormibacteraeota bacterium]
MIRAAQSSPVAAAVFAFVALALVVFAVVVLLRATARPDPLLALKVALAGMSLFLAVALAYETFALATRRAPTISALVDQIFTSQTVIWVVAFAALMFVVGLFAIHFTRFAGQGTLVVSLEGAFAANALIWVAAFGVLLFLAALAVIRLSPLVLGSSSAQAGISWWVLLLGGASYAAGGLVAWALNFRPVS